MGFLFIVSVVLGLGLFHYMLKADSLVEKLEDLEYTYKTSDSQLRTRIDNLEKDRSLLKSDNERLRTEKVNYVDRIIQSFDNEEDQSSPYHTGENFTNDDGLSEWMHCTDYGDDYYDELINKIDDLNEELEKKNMQILELEHNNEVNLKQIEDLKDIIYAYDNEGELVLIDKYGNLHISTELVELGEL
jgi:HD superfamily phosphohydrolase